MILRKTGSRICLTACAVVMVIVAGHAIWAEEQTAVKELTYTWRGYRIYYKTAGRSDSGGGTAPPPVVFLHGFGSSSFTWRHSLPVFADQHKVVAFDLLGFGKSDKPHIEYSPEIWVNLVNEYVRANDFSKVILIGNDLGGLVAAQFVLKFPDKVEKLVLVDSLGLSWRGSRMQRLFFTPVLGKAAFPLLFRRGYVQRTLENSIYADPKKVTDVIVEEYRRPFRSPGAGYVYRNVGKKMHQWQLGDRWKEIRAATLIVWGERDTLTPIEEAAELNSLIPNSNVVTVPGAGHYPQEESPAQFNKAIAEFLEDAGELSEGG